MTSAEVQARVEAEIGQDCSRTDNHGVDLRRCLVQPYKLMVCDTFPASNGGQSSPLQLWVVLEETPGQKEGYLIIFDEEAQVFGLAGWGADGLPVILGFHGSFLSTLEGM